MTAIRLAALPTAAQFLLENYCHIGGGHNYDICPHCIQSRKCAQAREWILGGMLGTHDFMVVRAEDPPEEIERPLPPVTYEERLGQVRLGQVESWKNKDGQQFTGTSEQREAMMQHKPQGSLRGSQFRKEKRKSW